jgi:hypothetical protein
MAGCDGLLRPDRAGRPGDHHVCAGAGRLCAQWPGHPIQRRRGPRRGSRAALAGQALITAINVPVDHGSYTVTGQAAVLTPTLIAGNGSYLLSGQPVITEQVWSVDAGHFVLTGESSLGTYPFPVGTGSYDVTGQDVFWIRAFLSSAGSYTVSGAVSLKVNFDAAHGNYVITGETQHGAFRMVAAPGLYTVIGIPIADATGPTDDLIFLVEAQAHDGTTLQHFYFSNRAITSLPTDGPANQF